MKTPLLVLLITSLLINYAQSQTSNNPRLIDLDFKSKKFSNSTPGVLDQSDENKLINIKKGEYYQVSITNINLNIYDVKIDKLDSIIPSNVQIPTFEAVGLDAITKLINGIVPFVKATVAENNPILEKMNNLSYVSYEEFGNEKNKDDQLKKEKQYKEDIEKLRKKVEEQSTLLKDLLKMSKDTLVKNIDGFCLNLNLQSTLYLRDLNVDNTDLSKHFLSLSEIFMLSNRYRKSLTSLTEKVNQLKKDLADFIKGNKNMEAAVSKDSKETELKKGYDDFISNADEAVTNFDKLFQNLTLEKITAFTNVLVHLQNNSSTTFTSLPLQLNGDLSKLQITISPKKAEYGYPTYKAEYLFPFPKFYAGVGASFYYSHLNSDYYSVKETVINDTVSEFKIIEENQSKGEIGVSALLHVGGKIYEDIIGAHFTIGPSLSLSAKPQLRMSVGGGFSIGKEKNMVSIDIIQSFGYVDRLSKLYSVEETYSAIPEISTVSKLSNAWTFAVGYIYKF